MIRIVLRKAPEFSAPAGTYNCHLKVDSNIEATISQGQFKKTFDFRRKLEFMEAHLRSLQAIQCEANVICSIVGAGNFRLDGTIEIWSESLTSIAREVKTSVENLCERASKEAGNFVGRLDFKLAREFSKAA